MNFRFLILACCIFAVTAISVNAQSFDANFMRCIAHNETRGITDPKVAAAKTNDSKYTGIYQMGVNYVGGYLCSNWADLKGMDAYQDWSKCDFKGTLSKNAKFNIKSYADFTTGPNAVAAQNYIMTRNSEATWRTIQRDPVLSKYIDQTVNGIKMTKETMVAMAHLTGPGGLKKTVQGGIEADKNGSTTIGYASCVNACLAGSTAPCDMKTGSTSGTGTATEALKSVCDTINAK